MVPNNSAAAPQAAPVWCCQRPGAFRVGSQTPWLINRLAGRIPKSSSVRARIRTRPCEVVQQLQGGTPTHSLAATSLPHYCLGDPITLKMTTQITSGSLQYRLNLNRKRTSQTNPEPQKPGTPEPRDRPGRRPTQRSPETAQWPAAVGIPRHSLLRGGSSRFETAGDSGAAIRLLSRDVGLRPYRWVQCRIRSLPVIRLSVRISVDDSGRVDSAQRTLSRRPSRDRIIRIISIRDCV